MIQTIEHLQSGALAGISHLKLSCGLTTFPTQIFQLSDSLEILDLSSNALSNLPDDFALMTKLRIVFFSNNQFTQLPEVLGRCPNLTMIGFKANRIREVPAGALPVGLRWLVLTDNEIEELPEAIGGCLRLQKLMLAGNRLRKLPISLAKCERLELMRIAANRLDELPLWLLKMPRLSWLAYSGNPFGAESEADALASASLNDVPWSAIELGQLLGEGASGVIHHATTDHGGAARHSIAVKMFKGAVTSDGFPSSEMAASMRAGTHPNLIGALGRVIEHPSGLDGLVMRLVNSEMRNLAGPPSLETCTRDVYQSSVNFDLPTLLRIARSIAAAAQHLHGLGIMHGDLYGHNILQGAHGRTILGDFGAASFYTADNGEVAQGLERLEIRAFGCMLEELIDRCVISDRDSRDMTELCELKAACLSEDPGSRPLFNEINERLLAKARSVLVFTAAVPKCG